MHVIVVVQYVNSASIAILSRGPTNSVSKLYYSPIIPMSRWVAVSRQIHAKLA